MATDPQVTTCATTAVMSRNRGSTETSYNSSPENR